MLDCTLRVSAIPLSIASISLTVTDHQSNETFGKIEFHNLLGLKYMVLISAISWIFFLSDQVIAYLMVTSVAAVSEIVYLGYKGDREVTWSEACSSFGKFCSRMGIGLVFHALALCCFLSLSVISAFRAFSVFDPPCVSSKEEEEDRRDN
ncbi:hypothetical protein CRG98_002164 [Punica granatum]|uniref:CASP-like protein n=1 Tax=Punica granatum TaxID=22663 RepID=A0A2I0LA44_PUNGR|nr:hypothetical protein CRG98_002164 [Punica granatum]